jgi:hypothetical protein
MLGDPLSLGPQTPQVQTPLRLSFWHKAIFLCEPQSPLYSLEENPVSELFGDHWTL